MGGASGNLTTIGSVGATWGDMSVGTGNSPSFLSDSPNCVSGCWQSRMSAGDMDVMRGASGSLTTVRSVGATWVNIGVGTEEAISCETEDLDLSQSCVMISNMVLHEQLNPGYTLLVLRLIIFSTI